MLTNLLIRDYVIVRELDLNFQKGFVALTGETGAGKSILIDALSLSLGARSESGLTRKGIEKSEIISEFDITGNAEATKWLKDNDLFNDGSLLLRRLIFSDGRSKGYINSIPCAISKLKEISELLIDIYSQNSFYSLIQPRTQMNILDDFCHAKSDLKEVGYLYKEWLELKKKSEEFDKNKQQIKEEFDYIKLLMDDYKLIDFSLENWESIQSEHKKLSNAKDLTQLIQQTIQIISADDRSLSNQLGEANRHINEACMMDSTLKDNAELIDGLVIQTNELERNLNYYLNQFNENENRINDLDKKIQAVYEFSRKHSLQPENFESSMDKAKLRFNELSKAFDDNTFGVQAEIAFEKFKTKAKELSELRKKSAIALSEKITLLLNQLSFSNALFKIEINSIEPNSSGIDQVDFKIQTYKGADLAPISKVASGGELSRISLAIRVASSEDSCVPVMIFDEVDVGIGGGVAEIVGKLLKQLGNFHQVFSITHLAQVASQANFHFKVSKKEGHENVSYEIYLLNNDQRIDETARMIGGLEITEATIQYAKEMLS